jgi:hypothetical protein
VWYLTSHLPSEIKPSDYLELFFASSSSSFFTLARFIQVSCVVSRVVLLWKMVFIDINLYSLHTGRQIITIEKTTLREQDWLDMASASFPITALDAMRNTLPSGRVQMRHRPPSSCATRI